MISLPIQFSLKVQPKQITRCVLYLTRYQGVQEAAREEVIWSWLLVRYWQVDRVTGEERPGMGHKLPYCQAVSLQEAYCSSLFVCAQAVIQEVQRLSCVAPQTIPHRLRSKLYFNIIKIIMIMTRFIYVKPSTKTIRIHHQNVICTRVFMVWVVSREDLLILKQYLFIASLRPNWKISKGWQKMWLWRVTTSQGTPLPWQTLPASCRSWWPKTNVIIHLIPKMKLIKQLSFRWYCHAR